MKIAIVGSRNFTDMALLESTMRKHFLNEKFTVVSGGAKGADKLAEFFCEKNNIDIEIIYPDWQKFGKAAGIIRNQKIVELADVVVAFWDGETKGTKNTIDSAIKKGSETIVVNFLK